MSDATTAATTATPLARRRLSFQTIDDVANEVNRLRRTPLKPRAKWNLPQACHHIAATLEGGLTPADTRVATPEESTQRDSFFKMIFAPEGMPENMPTSDAVTPPHDCGEEAVDRMVQAFARLSEYPHTHVQVSGCGPVPIDDVVKLHLAHAAHHLSFQEPVTPPRSGLKFDSVQAMIDDVVHLRRGYTRFGNWSLQQISSHVNRPLKALDLPVERTEPTEAEAATRDFFNYLVGGGKIPQGRPMPPGSEPQADATDAEVDGLLANLHRLNATTQPYVHSNRFGPVKLEDFKRFVLAHSAHHLAYLSPTTG